ncbi:SMP-30/gluconolactonase/LRE family protein [Halococcus salifodinae]|uniref:Senescence marker protein-30 n=1 Tax=Halococcus salifodinae DSM 8989 TaxID=1227456 RepID=M0MRX6_9EURY|nr:SMP-30/gluconolactonase/LRE family protein [Halococcus salifodinae]EMA48482.1 Senescence marker protein-30 [Halococcus salifodinae DSM 8989]
MDLERVADTTCTTGENPLWHPDHGALYWCDIPNGVLYRYDPAAADYSVVYETDDSIGGFTIQDDGSLLLFESSGRVERWRDGNVKSVIESIPREQDSRFNDVIAGPRGRVFAGTMPTDDCLGRLYRFDTNGSYHVVYEGLEIPNGIGFATDQETMYLTESEAQTIHQFDYDAVSGELTNHEVFLTTPDEPSVPDGMTIDTNGDIWSARWNGYALIRYAADGTELQRIEFPARKVASVTFGGGDYRDMYVTTAGGEEREQEGGGAGALFRLRPGVTGLEEFRSRISV